MTTMATPEQTELEELGRQIPRERRAQILRRLAQPGASDVVRPIARTNFGRVEADALLLVQALERIGTAEALFCLTRLGHGHESEVVRSAARRARTREPTGEPEDTTYRLLATPIEQQRRTWEGLGDGPRKGVEARIEALRQELEADRSVHGNSYLATLQRAVNNFPLAAWTGGSLEEVAALRLGQRTTLGEDEVDVLRQMRPERRRSFVSDSLRGREPARAHAALLVFPDSDPDSRLAELAWQWIGRDDQVAVAAARALLASGLVNEDEEVRRLVDQAGRTQTAASQRLIESLLDFVDRLPALRLNWAEPALQELILEAALTSERRRMGLAELLRRDLATLRKLDDLHVVVGALNRLCFDEESRSHDARALLRAARRVGASPRSKRMEKLFQEVLVVRSLREGMWDLFAGETEWLQGPDGPPEYLLGLALAAVVRAEDEQLALGRIGEVVLGGPSDPLLQHVVQLAHERVIDPTALADQLQEPAIEPALAHSSRLRRQNEEELEQLAAQVLTEQDEERQGFMREVRPLVERAIAGAKGNDRLEFQYRQLIAAFEHAEGVGSGEESPRTSATIDFNPHDQFGDPVSALLEYDRRAQSGPKSQRQGAVDRRRVFVHELGRAGIVEGLMEELFEGGPKMRAMARLSGEARRELLDVARERGLEPPTSWFTHPVLGGWLVSVMSTQSENLLESGVDARHLLSTSLGQGARAAQRLNTAHQQKSAQRTAVRSAIARVAAPVFEELDSVVFGYARVRRALEEIRWEPAARLGEVLARSQVDPERHQIVGGTADRYVVRSGGIAVEDRTIVRAIVEPAIETELSD